MPTHNILNAVNSGIQGYQRGVKSRADAAHTKEVRAGALADAQRNRQAQPDADLVRDAKEQELRALQNTLRRQGGAAAQKEFNSAMRRYQVDSNPQQMNRVLQNNEYMRDLIPNLARIDRLNLDDPEDRAYLKGALTELEAEGADAEGNPVDTVGIDPATLEEMDDPDFWRDNPALMSRFVRTVGKDGTFDYMDMNALKPLTGYYQEQDGIANEKEISDLALKQKRKDYLEGTKARKSTADQVNTDEVTAALKAEDAGEGTVRTGVVIAKYNKDLRDGMAIAEKNADLVKRTKAEVFDRAGGRDNFKSLDFSNPDVVAEYQDAADTIISAKGQKFSEKDKDRVIMFKRLADASGTITDGLDEDNTGIIDDFLSQVNKYNPWAETDVNSTSARSAYNRMFNIILQGRSGAAVSLQEMGRMKKEYGSLGQQFAPVMVQIKEQLRDMRASLKGVGTFKDEVVRSVYLGATEKELNDVIARIGIVLSELDNITLGKKKFVPEPSRRNRRNSRSKPAITREEMNALWDES